MQVIIQVTQTFEIINLEEYVKVQTIHHGNFWINSIYPFIISPARKSSK